MAALSDFEYFFAETINGVVQPPIAPITCDNTNSVMQANGLPRLTAIGNRRIEINNLTLRRKDLSWSIKNRDPFTVKPAPNTYKGVNAEGVIDWYPFTNLGGGGLTEEEVNSIVEAYLQGYITEQEVNTLLGGYLTSKQITDLLNNKVDKVDGKGLSTNDYTAEDKEKLANLTEHFQGSYPTFEALQTAVPVANPGNFAEVDAGPGSAAIRYNWDVQDGWKIGSSGTTYSDSETIVFSGGSALVKNDSITDAKLATDNKTGLLSSINAVITGDARLSFAAVINQVLAWLGNPGSLTTTAKNYADAINEINAKSGTTPISPSGVNFSTAPGTPTITTSNITETASVVNDNGATVNIASQILSFALAATGKKRVDAVVVKYTTPAAYEIITGTEVASNQPAPTPSIPVNRLFVRYLIVSDGAATTVNTGGGHAQNTDTGTNSPDWTIGSGIAGTIRRIIAASTDAIAGLTLVFKGTGKLKLDGPAYVTGEEKITVINTAGELLAKYLVAEEQVAVPPSLSTPGIPGTWAREPGFLWFCYGPGWEKFASISAALNYLEQWVAIPATPTSTGIMGQRAYDSINDLMYDCVATNTWIRYTTTKTW